MSASPFSFALQQKRTKEDFHPRVTVDQDEGLCHRITLHSGRLNIETGHHITVLG